ncbi:K(+)-transporting ATPase subunit C [Flavobacterium sp. AG291]|uniref:K(+)-transporting ATPase subunit C n=1 Tax=Flavobacterium sp. AG291 TaxID=2184000 RepID=UPI000E0B1954|nr:K(+)-transporting ATPase subunit C [Flavobacterium sp. AG291]RDI06702.1 K+-transporting ATPase ATPase C chain [Flavobacterium sp. AG291]
MKQNIMPAIRLTLFCAVFFSGIYTMAIWGVAQLTPNKGKGDVVEQDGKQHYINIAQGFTKPEYFWPRPSAVDYNAAGSGGSNKGPSNPQYLEMIQQRIDTFLLQNPAVNAEDIPSELVTASGSGLDPNISIQGAKVQVKRIAAARKIDELKLVKLIEENTEAPLLGALGTEKINVLKLNLALDKLK